MDRDIKSNRIRKALTLTDEQFKRLFGSSYAGNPAQSLWRVAQARQQAAHQVASRRQTSTCTAILAGQYCLAGVPASERWNTSLMNMMSLKVPFPVRCFGWKIPSFAMDRFVCRAARMCKSRRTARLSRHCGVSRQQQSAVQEE